MNSTAKAGLTPDATFHDVLHTLANPEEYLRIAIGQLLLCKRQHGNSALRIGVTGKGVEPCIKVVYNDGGREHFHQAYGGRHEFTGCKVYDGATWSSALISFDDVRLLLGELRSRKFGMAAIQKRLTDSGRNAPDPSKPVASSVPMTMEPCSRPSRA